MKVCCMCSMLLNRNWQWIPRTSASDGSAVSTTTWSRTLSRCPSSLCWTYPVLWPWMDGRSMSILWGTSLDRWKAFRQLETFTKIRNMLHVWEGTATTSWRCASASLTAFGVRQSRCCQIPWWNMEVQSSICLHIIRSWRRSYRQPGMRTSCFSDIWR